jgi:hypothetical protein
VWTVTGTALSSIVITRNQYGTVAGNIAVDASRAILPEIYSAPVSILGARTRLYRVQNGVATLIWVGSVRAGPVATENGAAFAISCVSILEQELDSRWVDAGPAATVTGFDSSALYFALFNNDGLGQARSSPSRKAHVFSSWRPCVAYALETLKQSMTGSFGLTSVFASVLVGVSETVITINYSGGDLGSATLRVGNETYSAVSREIGTVREHVFKVPTLNSALARVGFLLDGVAVTVVTPHYDLSNQLFLSTVGDLPDTTITRVLSGIVSDSEFVELSPDNLVSGGPSPNDTTVSQLGHDSSMGAFCFRSKVRVLSRDPTAIGPSDSSDYRVGGYPTTTTIPLRQEVVVTANHWLDGVRTTIQESSVYDSRNWSWLDYDSTKRASRDGIGAVEYRSNGNDTLREFACEESKLRGCAVTVDSNGLLTIVDIRPPLESGTTDATITLSDLISGELSSVSTNDDRPVTTIQFATPLRDITLSDAVAIGRYRDQETIEVYSQSTRRDPRAESDPIGYALLACGPLLSRWSKQNFIHTIHVPRDEFRDTCKLGAVINFPGQAHVINREGGRGFTAKKGIVVGREEFLDKNVLTLTVLDLSTQRAFAPCARVESISGSTLNVATAYAGSASDYAGSGLPGYQHTTNDRGTGWFSPGDKLLLVQRDTSTAVEYQCEVTSVTSTTIKLTASVPTSPVNWPLLATSGIVDVVFDSYATATSDQRIFAAVGDASTRTIGSTSDSNHKWCD